MKNSIYSFFKIVSRIIPEILIIFSFIVTINSYIGNTDKTLNADGIGYYDYLPSFFIHHDLIRKNFSRTKNLSKYKRIVSFKHKSYNEYKGFVVNKYPVGTALLQAPFFWWEYISRSDDVTGYEYGFQRSIFHASLFYLFLGLVFFRKVLELYQIKPWVIILCQLLVVFATPITHFANCDAGFSHVYSFFAISLFAFLFRSFFIKKKQIYFVMSCATLGLIFLLRNPNLMILGVLPLLAGNWKIFTDSLKTIFSQYKYWLVGLLLFSLVSYVQLHIWYLQTGDFFVYSYQGEGFNFLDPHFFDILFSYQKGLFVYTPLLFLSLLVAIWLFFRGNRFIISWWLIFFFTITYIMSSWWSWHYGASYGMRVYIDFLVILFLPFALFLTRNSVHKLVKGLLIILSLLTIPINVIQTYQYKKYILHWDSMNKEKYWKVFLKTAPVYEGLIWRKYVDINKFDKIETAEISGKFLESDTRKLILSDTLFSESYDAIRFEQSQNFDPTNKTKIEAFVYQDDSIVGSLYTYLLHFEKEGFNKKHHGYYDMVLNDIDSSKTTVLEVFLTNYSQEGNEVAPITVKYLKK